MSQYLSEAFKKLDTLNEETFSVTDSGLQDFVKFTENDEDENIIDIIDVEAETVEDLEDSYIGKVILDCCVCHSKLYKDTEDVVIEDDLANVGEECPFCYANDGYKVVGQVAEFDEKEIEDDEDKEDDVDDATASADEGQKSDDDDSVDENLSEGIFGLGKKKKPNYFSKEEIAKRRQAQEDEFNKQQAEMDRKERERGAEIARGWKEREDRERQAEREYSRSRYNSIKGDKPSNTGHRGVNYSGGDYYTESYKDTHMIMGGDGSDVYTDEDLKKIWDNSHTTDPSMKQYKSFDDWKSDTISQMEEINESLNEDINNLSLDTDDTHMEMTSDESGKVTITTEPIKTAVENNGETIEPVNPETQNEIESNVANGEEIEIDVDEFDEESFDELSEGYLKKVYENVDSFKTSRVSYKDNKLVLEGVIKFNSGKAKKTTFLFENKEITKKGKVRFIGENKEIAKGKKSFTITGKIDNKRFLSESFNYNYGVKTPLGKVKRLYGTINK